MSEAHHTAALSGWYRAWRIVLATYIATGLLALLSEPSLLRMAPGLLMMSAMSAIITVTIATDARAHSFGAHLARIVRLGAVCAGALLATVGHLAALGLVTVLLCGGLVVSSPWALHRARATCQEDGVEPAASAAGGSRTSEAASAVDLSLASTREIAGAWGRTYWLLGRATTWQKKMQIVDERQQLLDELERRDAIAVRRWLDSGPRAAADPAKYFHRREPPEAIAS